MLHLTREGANKFMDIKEHMDHAYARRFAGVVARYLRDRYGARKVMLFGSLVSGLFNPDFSSINIGFEGVVDNMDADATADSRFHFGYRDPDGLSRLQIVSLNELSPEIRAFIRMESEEI